MCLPGEELRFPDFQISGFYANCLCFQIVPTGKPSPLTACQIVNKTLTSLKVQCQEGRKSLLGKPRYSSSAFISGFDGGLPANFLLELYDAEKMELKSQVTNKVPIFEVRIFDQPIFAIFAIVAPIFAIFEVNICRFPT